MDGISVLRRKNTRGWEVQSSLHHVRTQLEVVSTNWEEGPRRDP